MATTTSFFQPTTSDLPRLARRVKPDPHRPGPDRWHLIPSNRPIWAIIMHIFTIADIDERYPVSEHTIAQTAADYDVSLEEVRAAIAYYAANRAAIDTILATNTDLFVAPRNG